MSYTEEDYLQLSGIQHFAFCRRQWALIHVENQWAENVRTTLGNLLHERAHDITIREKRGDLLTVRGLWISSSNLGVSGQCDVVEFRLSPNGVPLQGIAGLWLPFPVEYKHGCPKNTDADILQLCGQAMCLEEMFCCDIPEGALYYDTPRRREIITFTDVIRQKVRDTLLEMHQLYQKGYTPKMLRNKSCNACSLKDLCLPTLSNSELVENYIAEALEEGR